MSKIQKQLDLDFKPIYVDFFAVENTQEISVEEFRKLFCKNKEEK